MLGIGLQQGSAVPFTGHRRKPDMVEGETLIAQKESQMASKRSESYSYTKPGRSSRRGRPSP